MLAVAFTAIGAAIAVFAFIVIYLTVTHLVAPWFAGWAWVVLAVTEGSFTGSYLGWLLLDLRDDPPRATRVILACYLSAFAAGSFVLNVYAARANVADAIAHALTVAAFFGYLVLAKVIVRRLSVSREARDLGIARADAIACARDILRADLGVWWRFTAPVMLRRQLRSGRLPAAVADAIGRGMTYGGAATWEPVVQKWVTDSLTLSERVSAQLQAAREATVQASLPATPEVTPEPPLPVTAAGASGHGAAGASGHPGAAVQVRPRRKVQATPRRITDTDLKKQVRALFDGDPSVSVNAAANQLGRSRDRVRPLLDEVRREAHVLPMERKRS